MSLKESFQCCFEEINELIERKTITINDTTFDLEFFLGGDYKFLLLMMGMKSATSLYACLCCKIHKDYRWKMNFDLEHYNSCPLKRTMDEINAMANKAGNKEIYSCEHTPLINIDLEHVILDELHLLLRIMDVLIGNLVKEVIQWDTKDNFQREKMRQKI